jgi:hypothetical protein
MAVSKETAKKIVSNPKTPIGIKKFYAKKFGLKLK